MVQIDVRYEGGLRCRAHHGPSGVELTTDAPVDNQGRGEAFSPTDLVATALGACIFTIMGIYAEREGVDLEGMKATVGKIMSSEGPRRIARLEVVIDMPPGLEPKHRRAMERCAEVCPVRLSLKAETEVPVTFRYPD